MSNENEELEMFGGVKVDELELMAKTHPRSALRIAYGEGLVVGINRAKDKFKADSAQEIEGLFSTIYKLDSEIAELQAHINLLREALRKLSISSEMDWIKNNVTEALAQTPAQSLQEFENDVIERCVAVMEEKDCYYGEWMGNVIRALKK